jgi:transcription antitermination factor NusG
MACGPSPWHGLWFADAERVMAYWGCVQLQPQRQALAVHFLGRAGYETYRPLYRERTRSRKVTPQPLFPGYAFILIEQRWYSACSTPGVVRLISDGLRPARVPDDVIAKIRSRNAMGWSYYQNQLCGLAIRSKSCAVRFASRSRSMPARPRMSGPRYYCRCSAVSAA